MWPRALPFVAVLAPHPRSWGRFIGQGEVAAVFGRSRTPGVVHDVAPLILVDGSRGWDDIAQTAYR